MKSLKVKSFTLSELLVVMIITAIVVGLAFSVLRLVQRQIYLIQKNYDKSVELALFEQKLWQDFNEHPVVVFNSKANKLQLESEIDTVIYHFESENVLRDKDTIKVKVNVANVLFEGKKVNEGDIDAIRLNAETELPEYSIFVFRKLDVNFYMNRENGI